MIDLEDAATLDHDRARRSSSPRRSFDTLGATGSYNTPTLGGDYRGGTIGASPAYSFTAHVAEVEVDAETGARRRASSVWVAHDCGRALNPMLVEGQMEGSAYMGVAEALLEDHDVNRFGLHAGPSLLDYRIPTSLDTPELARADRRERSIPRARTARRRPARARCTRRSRRSRTRSTTRSASASTHLPFTPAQGARGAARAERARARRGRDARAEVALMLRLPAVRARARRRRVAEAVALLAAHGADAR